MKLSCCQGPAALPSCLRFVGWQYRWYNPSVRCDAHVLPSVASKARGSGLRGKWLLPPNPTEGAKRAKEPIAKAAASVRVQILQVTKQAPGCALCLNEAWPRRSTLNIARVASLVIFAYVFAQHFDFMRADRHHAVVLARKGQCKQLPSSCFDKPGVSYPSIISESVITAFQTRG